MSNIKETSDEMISLRARTFIGLLVSVIAVTNSFTLVYQKIHRNEELQLYNKERSDKIAERKKQEAISHFEMETLKTKLKNCIDDKEF
mgnify:CR=1 FL=1